MKFHHRLHFAQCLFIRNFLYIRIYPRRLLYRKNRGHEVLTPCTSRCSCTSRVLLGVGLRRTVSALYRKHRGHEVLTPCTSRCSCTSRVLLGVWLRRTVYALQEASGAWGLDPMIIPMFLYLQDSLGRRTKANCFHSTGSIGGMRSWPHVHPDAPVPPGFSWA